MNRDDRRVKAFRLVPEAIIDILAGNVASVNGVPPDAKVVRYAQEWETNSAIVIIAHPSFEEVPLGKIIPIVDLTFPGFDE